MRRRLHALQLAPNLEVDDPVGLDPDLPLEGADGGAGPSASAAIDGPRIEATTGSEIRSQTESKVGSEIEPQTETKTESATGS